MSSVNVLRYAFFLTLTDKILPRHHFPGSKLASRWIAHKNAKIDKEKMSAKQVMEERLPNLDGYEPC